MRIAVLQTDSAYGGLYHGIRNTALALSAFADVELVSGYPDPDPYDWIWVSDIGGYDGRYSQKCILHVHGWAFPQLTPYAPIREDWLRKVKDARLCIVSSNALAEKVPGAIPIWNCFDPDIFCPAKKPGQGLVSTVTVDTDSAAGWRKGLDRLDAIRLRVDRLGLHMKLTPQQVADALRDSRIFIHLSRFESCSLSIIEALACGLPIIATDTGDNSAMIRDAGIVLAGSLVDAHPQEVIELAISTIERDYTAYRHRALARRQEFLPQIMGERLCQILRSV